MTIWTVRCRSPEWGYLVEAKSAAEAAVYALRMATPKSHRPDICDVMVTAQDEPDRMFQVRTQHTTVDSVSVVETSPGITDRRVLPPDVPAPVERVATLIMAQCPALGRPSLHTLDNGTSMLVWDRDHHHLEVTVGLDGSTDWFYRNRLSNDTLSGSHSRLLRILLGEIWVWANASVI